MNLGQARAAMFHSAFCGLSRGHLGELVTELVPRWEARCESGRRQRLAADAPSMVTVIDRRHLSNSDAIAHMRARIDEQQRVLLCMGHARLPGSERMPPGRWQIQPETAGHSWGNRDP